MTRLFARARRPHPTGIDRVQLEYALYFARSHPAATRYCVLAGGDFRELPRPLVDLLLGHLTRRWLGVPPTGPRQRLRAQLAQRLFARKGLIDRLLLGLSRELRPARQPEAYLNVSHKHLDRLGALRAAFPHPALRSVVMLHDLLPISHPERFAPALCAEFASGLRQAARHADLIVTNSAATARELAAWADSEDLSLPGVDAIGLGVRKGLPPARARTTDEPARFVVVGTIEKRKNLELLFDVWARLSERAAPPRLCLLGALTGDPAQAVAIPPALAQSIEVLGGLDDRAIGEHLHTARALLFPSLAEGYGLPVVEALELGTPVLCSDLPVLREVAGDAPEFLPPHDRAAWLEAIVDYSQEQGPRRTAQLARLAHYSPPRWDDHFHQLLRAIDRSG